MQHPSVRGNAAPLHGRCRLCLLSAAAAAEPRPPSPLWPAEFMAGGSLKSALSRRADIVAGALTRVVLALDAAKVGHVPKFDKNLNLSFPFSCAVGACGGCRREARPPRCAVRCARAIAAPAWMARPTASQVVTDLPPLRPLLPAGHGVSPQQEPGAL